MENKKELRRLIAARKRAESDATLDALSKEILASLERLPAFREANTILMYHSLPDEVRTWNFVDRWCGEKRIILPVVVGDELELRIYTGRDSLQLGAYNILEPTGPLFADYDSIDLAVVPGVAFTCDGVRLGRGKGYYDRLLPHIKARKVGICFPFQLLDYIPAEPFDINMDDIVCR